MKNRIWVKILLVLIVLSILPISIAETREQALESKIRATFADAYKLGKKRQTNMEGGIFFGHTKNGGTMTYCSLCAGMQLVAANVIPDYLPGNGNQAYDNYSKSKTSGEYQKYLYPGVNKGGTYTIEDVCNIINEKNKNGDLVYVVFCFGKGSSSVNGQGYGHAVTVSSIYNGRVYFSEWNSAFISKTIKEFANRYKQADFKKDGRSGTQYLFDGAVEFSTLSNDYHIEDFSLEFYAYPKDGNGTDLKDKPLADANNISRAEHNEKLHIKGLYKNKDDEYWLGVEKDGKLFYICANSVSKIDETDDGIIKVDGISYDKGIVTKSGTLPFGNLPEGKSYDIKGTVSYKNTIVAAKARVYKVKIFPPSIAVEAETKVVPINSSSFDLKTSNINLSKNGGISFAKLTPGYKVFVLGITYNGWHDITNKKENPIKKCTAYLLSGFTIGDESNLPDVPDDASPDSNTYTVVAKMYYNANFVDDEPSTTPVPESSMPSIVSQPTNMIVEVGETATFTVEATNAAIYQWYYRTSSTSDWAEVSSNGKSNSYSFIAEEKNDGYQYRCLIENGVGSVSSNIATLTVVKNIDPQSNICGANLTWARDEDSVLTISGTGKMYDYDEDSNIPPWWDTVDQIEKVIIQQGATSIGDFAFSNMENLSGVIIPNSVTSIGNDAFAGCSSDLTIYCYNGSKAQEYAEANNIKYILLDEPENTPTVTPSVEPTETPSVTVTPTVTPITYTITLSANGGQWSDGSTEKKIEAHYGDVIKVPEGPAREGYDFDYWEGSKYYPGDDYTVTEDHTLKAIWKTVVPGITISAPTDQYVTEGQTATFTVSVSPAGAVLQWYINRNDGNDWVAIPGATSTSYTTAATKASNDGYKYKCVATFNGVTVESDVAVLHVKAYVEPPKTGDRRMPILYTGLALVGIVGIMTVLRVRKKHE